MSENNIKLGLMPPLTGLVGIYGSEIARAGHIACQEINENGGVLGRPLQLVIEDDGSLPESAVVAARKLVEEHHCSAIIGNLLSNSRIAVAYRIAEPHKIPYLNFSFYEGSILSRYFFHFAALPNQQIEWMIPYMCNNYGPRMFFAGNNYEWPRGSIDAAKRALDNSNGVVVGEEYCPIGVDIKTIDNLLDRVSESKPDVFVPYFAGVDQVNLLTRFTERGMKPSMAVVMGHYDEMMASQLTPTVREGFYSSNTYFMSVETDKNKEYLTRLANQTGVTGIWPQGNGILTNFGEGTYVCVKAFAKAANAAGNLESGALVDALKNIRVSAPQGIVQMNPDHHHARVNTYLTRCQADGVFRIVEKFGAIDAVLPQRYNHQRIHHQATLEDDIRLQARMLEQMAEAVLLINASDSTIVYSNAGAENMFGYNKNELIGKSVACLNEQTDSHSNETNREIYHLLNNKGEWKGEVRNRKKDGTFFWCSASMSCFTHPLYGEVWMAVYSDISPLKTLQQELQNHHLHLEDLVKQRTAALESAKTEAERANRAKNEFLSRMSHELRTPMNAILGFSQVLELEKIEPQQKDFVREILQAGNHLLELINELLDYSRIEAGRMTIAIEALSLAPLLKQSIQMVQSLAQTNNITVINQCKKDYTLLADPTRLRQILVNLLSNAIKYNSNGGSVTLHYAVVSDNRLRINISDTGHGIAPEKHHQVFQPFERLGAEFGEINGTGIGLALSQQLAQLMAGSLGLQSNPDQGSTFWLELPLSETSANKNANATTATEDANTDSTTPRTSVLYIEDNAANLRLVEAIFRRQQDFTLLSAGNGDYGLELAKKYLPAVILLDIHLPGMNGYQVLQALKQDSNTCDIPAIAISAEAMPIDIERGLNAGFVEYLTKPVKVEILLAAINKVLGNNTHDLNSDGNQQS